MPTDTTVTVDIEVNAEPAIRGFSLAAIKTHTLGCRVCRHYLARRGRTLLLAVVVKSIAYDLIPASLMYRYLMSVHARHLAGESLSTRRHTAPKRDGRATVVRVQRACNGCGKQLGDAKADELEAAAAGLPLPDVRVECGCWTEDQAA